MSTSDLPAKAPFNFVSLPSGFIERYKEERELPGHGRIYRKEEGYYSGEISYKAVIDQGSALFISDGNLKADGRNNGTKSVDQFFKNAHGQYTIPGSSMRGLIYNNIQILGLCDPRDFIEDSRFTYRDMASNDRHHRDEYTRSIGIDNKGKEKTYQELQRVKGGYLRKKGKDYELIPAIGYYRIREDRIPDKLKDDKRISCMYSDRDKLKEDVKIRNERDRKNELKNNKNKTYKPYYCRIYYKLKGKNQVIPDSLRFQPAEGLREGFLLCSGYIPGKLTHYIIGAKDTENAPVKLDSRTIRWYQDDLTRRKETGRFYQLPTDQEPVKPVFYTDDGQNIWIGMTPYLRILYGHSVHEGIHPQAVHLDYAKAMFGFTTGGRDSSAAYKSRLSFTDAPAKGKVDVGEPVDILPGAPKPTCYPEYILQNKANDKGNGDITLVSYADAGFAIRGYKQYWFSDSLKTLEGDIQNEKVIRKIQPITNASFEGKIYFENLTKDELGLLAYALKIKDGACHGIGMAKAYGYGRIKLEDIEIKTYDYDAMYRSFASERDMCVREDIDSLIQAYQDYVSEKYGINIQDDPGVMEFIYMKTNCLKANLTEYQKLNEFKDNCILPKVKDYEKEHEKPRKTQPNGNQYQNTRPKGKQFPGNRNKNKNSGNFRGKEHESAYSDNSSVGNRLHIPPDWNK